MAITLNDVKMNMGDKLTASVAEEFRRSNYLLQNMVFDDAVLPAGNGSALSYGYYRVVEQPTSDFRAVGAEYVVSNTKKEKVTVDLKTFGGAFEIDRLLASAGGFVNEVDLQLKQMICSAQTLFNSTVINGDTSANSNAFDGLNKALTGTASEYNASPSGSEVDISAVDIDSNYVRFLDMLDEFVLGMKKRPTALLANTKLLSRIRACARRSGIIYETSDDFGRTIATYDGIPLVDLGERAPGVPVIKDESGIVSLYAVSLGLDGLHGVCMKNEPIVKVWAPDFSTAGAVKKGEVEMTAAIALKSTAAAGVFRNIRIS